MKLRNILLTWGALVTAVTLLNPSEKKTIGEFLKYTDGEESSITLATKNSSGMFITTDTLYILNRSNVDGNDLIKPKKYEFTIKNNILGEWISDIRPYEVDPKKIS